MQFTSWRIFETERDFVCILTREFFSTKLIKCSFVPLKLEMMRSVREEEVTLPWLCLSEQGRPPALQLRRDLGSRWHKTFKLGPQVSGHACDLEAGLQGGSRGWACVKSLLRRSFRLGLAVSQANTPLTEQHVPNFVCQNHQDCWFRMPVPEPHHEGSQFLSLRNFQSVFSRVLILT